MVMKEENAERIKKHFGSKKLSDLPLPQIGKIVTIPCSLSIREASQILADFKIQSAPIVNEAMQAKEWWEKYSGVFDMYQLLEFALFEAQQAFSTGDSQDHFTKILIEALSTSTVSQLRSIDDHSTLRHLPADASILDAMELVAKFDAKRIAVVGPQSASSSFMNFITASTILERIEADCCCDGFEPACAHDSVSHAAKHCLDGLKVADLHLDVPGLCGVVSASDSTPVLGAFVTLYHTNVRGIAIVNESKQITGNLSCSDIHYLITHPQLFADVCISHMPVRDYIALVRNQCTLRPPVTCTANETLSYVIGLMIHNRVHRVYVVNNNNFPTGVVTVRDIIRALLPQLQNEPKSERRQRQWDEDSDMAFSLTHSSSHARLDSSTP
eukprot:c6508_g1_i1.p1 GENE.c6508_g1_i1~~c6508_g1_i1.p1  ORF type:complete len:385 (+),score=95.29 c6508_g1_i1:219-1373(+)